VLLLANRPSIEECAPFFQRVEKLVRTLGTPHTEPTDFCWRTIAKVIATDGRNGARKGVSERSKKDFQIFHEKLPIFFPNNAVKQHVARKLREVYWKAPE
jgi:hypothetical protein